MKRRNRFLLAYLAVGLVAVAGAILLAHLRVVPLWAWLVAAAVLFVLQRLVARQWHDLLLARLRLAEGHHDEAVQLAERFLAQVDRRPWLRHLIWVNPSTYTLSVRAMALNNIGAAQLGACRLDAAEAALTAALAEDPAYALAHRNLALLRERQGRPEEAAQSHARADEHGFASDRPDRLIDFAKHAFARFESALARRR